MGKDTGIQWCDSTVNPVMGCDGCELWSADKRGRRTCYAGLQHEKPRNKGWASKFLEPEMFAGRMSEAAKWSDLTGKARPDKPWLDGYSRIIFINDMGDALSERIPFEFLEQEIVANVTSEQGQRHLWIWLTKRPSRMVKFDQWMAERSPDERLWWPTNLWAATTVTMPRTEARADFLRRVGHEGTTRLLSFEPILEEPNWDRCMEPRKGEGSIHGAFLGGESGEPSIVAAMDVRVLGRGVVACRRHGVAPFVKQLGRVPVATLTREGLKISEELTLADSHGGDWEEWRDHVAELMVRELPAVRGMKAVEPASAASEPEATSEAPGVRRALWRRSCGVRGGWALRLRKNAPLLARCALDNLIEERNAIEEYVKALDTVNSLAWIGVVGLLDRSIDMMRRAIEENESAEGSR